MIPYKYVGFLRGLGFVVLFAVLSYFGDAANLNGIASPIIAGLIASIAAAIEHSIEEKKKVALFGAVKV